MSTAPRPPRPRRHPLLAIARRYYVGGGLIIFLSALLALPIGLLALSPTILVPLLLMLMLGAFVAWNGHALDTLAKSGPKLSGALAFLSRGKLDEAERLHAEIAPNVARRPPVRRVLETQRARIALARGDAEVAAKHASLAIDPATTGFFTQGWERQHRADAFALRAFARASLLSGGEHGASDVDADVREVEASTHARPGALGRVALARAMVIAKGGDKSALSAHFAKHEELILEHALPRERALARALKALSRSPGRSIYREPVAPEESDADVNDNGESRTEASTTNANDLRSWIARIAPEAASFVPDRRRAGGADGQPPITELELDEPRVQIDPDAMREIAAARRAAAQPRQVGNRAKTFVLWIALISMFVALWQFLSPTDTKVPGSSSSAPVADAADVAATADSSWAITIFGGLFVIFIAVALIGGFILRYRKLEEQLVDTEREAASGDVQGAASAEKRLRGMTQRRFPILVAVAQCQLTSLAIRRGDFTTAIQEADKGIAAVGKNASTQAIASDIQTPFLIGERAFALTVLGRFAEAETELATMQATYPDYGDLPRVMFRVRLMKAVRMNDVPEAARIAMSRTSDLALDLRTDLLADVVLTAASRHQPMMISSTERERIANELRDLPEVAAWIDGVAPHITKGAPPPQVKMRVTATNHRFDEDDEGEKNEDDDYYYEDATDDEDEQHNSRRLRQTK